MKKNNTFVEVIGKVRLYEACVTGKEIARVLAEEGIEEAEKLAAEIEGGYYYRAAIMAAATNQIYFGWPGQGSVCLDRTADLMEIVGSMSCFRRKFRFVGNWDWQDVDKGRELWSYTVRI